MMTERFIISTFKDEDGVFVAECLNIPGCVSQGETEAEAILSLQDAIRLCLEVRREKGMTLTVNVKQVEMEI